MPIALPIPGAITLTVYAEDGMYRPDYDLLVEEITLTTERLAEQNEAGSYRAAHDTEAHLRILFDLLRRACSNRYQVQTGGIANRYHFLADTWTGEHSDYGSNRAAAITEAREQNAANATDCLAELTTTLDTYAAA